MCVSRVTCCCFDCNIAEDVCLRGLGLRYGILGSAYFCLLSGIANHLDVVVHQFTFCVLCNFTLALDDD